MIKLACKRVLIAAAMCAFAAVVPGSFAQTSSAANDLATHSYHPPGMPIRTAHPDAPKTRIPSAAIPLSNTAYTQIGALLQEKQARTMAQHKVSSKILYTSRMMRGMAAAPGVQYLDTAAEVDDRNRIAVDISATVSEDLLNRLSNAGAAVLHSSKRYHNVRALVPADKVEVIAGWQEVRFISPKREASTARVVSTTSKGNAVSNRLRSALTSAGNGIAVPHSEGDVAMMADKARLLGIDGTGLKIGVLSDGVSSLAQSQYLGALGRVIVLPGQAGSGDEGTAMLEIVHSLAPGATLYFATAFGGIESFAENIRDLRAAGCDVIVDDVTYFAETPFQNGQADSIETSNTNGGVVIQAVNDVVADGAFYFSSAGNEGAMDNGSSGTWEGDFMSGGSVPPALPPGVSVHLFGGLPYNTIDTYGQIVILNWADPLGASANDYDLFVVSSDGSTLRDASTDVQNGTGDPFEFIGSLLYPGDRIVITKMPTAQKVFMHLETWRTYLQQGTTGSTFGHNGAPAAFTVAAAPACWAIGAGYPSGPCVINTDGTVTPKPFTAAQVLEPYSSDGPRKMFFEADGTPMATGDFTSAGGKVYAKPDFTAADGVSVTGVGGFGSPFYGTSAAAPHAAAIAALLKSAVPTITAGDLATALNGTALDVLQEGPDNISGSGILMAKAAVNDAGLTTGVANPAILSAVATEHPGNGDGAVTAGEGALLTITLGNTAGAAKATAISGTLSAVTSGVYVTLPSASTFADLAVGATANNDKTLTFTLPGNFDDCSGLADFALTLNYAGGPDSTRTLMFTAPVGPNPVMINGTLGTIATESMPATVTGTTGMQTGRLYRDGVASVCGAPKTSPMMYDAVPHLYDSYSMTACRTGCVQVQLYEPNIDLITGTEMLFGSAYIPSFSPANPLTNYAADAGSSAMLATFGVDATAGSDMAVTITDVLGSTSAGANYTLAVPACMLTCGAATMPPVAVVHNVTVEPGDDGKAAASIDNGSNSPSGLAITMTQTPAGPYSVGDTTVMLTVVDAYGATAQASAVVTVLPALSIAPASGSTSKTVTAGQTASYTLNVKSNITTGITFSCSGLPDKSACSFGSFTPVTSSLTSGTVGLTITTTASSTTASLMAIPPAGNSQIPIYAVFALPFAGLAGLGRCKNRKALMRVLVMMVIIIVAIGWASCGSSTKTPVTVPGTPAGTYAVTITGTNATMSTTTTVNLVVQ